MEVLGKEQYGELDAFVSSHPLGGFTQASFWRNVKRGWDFDVVVSRNHAGQIQGSVSVLRQRIPGLGCTLLYAPRGPVCDVHDKGVLADLKSGIDALAKEHHAYAFRCDPDVLFSDEEFACRMKSLGFRQEYGPDGFEGVQARFNYRLYIGGRSREELFANLSQACRRKVRIAMKNNVEIRVEGKSAVESFQRLMETTGRRDGFAIRPAGYFANMLDAMGEHARLYMGYYNGTPVCGALTTNYAGKCCYVYGASSNEHREVMPNYLMQWEMICWAVETGCEIYDFQGISGSLSTEGHMGGLYQFKKGFNGQVDELAGEFVYTYRPVMEKLVNAAISGREWLRRLKRGVRS